METELPFSSHMLILPHIRVQNANAISSPLTHGFPSITAFMGFMWALERKAHAAGIDDIIFNAVGVICHDFQEQVTDSGFTYAFNLTRNPIEKDGKTAPIIEEGRIHLDVSLLLAIAFKNEDIENYQIDEYVKKIAVIAQNMRIAGGSIIPPSPNMAKHSKPYWIKCNNFSDNDNDFFDYRKNCYRLLPGYALVERSDLIPERLKKMQETQPEATPLDAWLSLSRVNWRCKSEAQSPKTETKKENIWENDQDNGWIVPMPVGYGAVGEMQQSGSVSSARDNTIPFQPVESLFSIGEWIAPFRLKHPNDLLWYPSSFLGEKNIIEKSVYRCHNFYQYSL